MIVPRPIDFDINMFNPHRAEIFTKKQISSAKAGVGGKTVEWPQGQP